MIAWVPLAAADIDYLKLIGVIVAVSIMAINHLLAGLKKSRAQAPPPNATPPHDPAAASMRKDLNAEVKEFLRRAAQQRGSQPSARPQASLPPGEKRRDDSRRQRSKSQSSKPAVPKLEDSLASRRVTSRLETSSLDERTEQLSNLDRSSQIDAHVQQTLDHPIGQLTSGLQADAPGLSGPAETVDLQTDLAADIAAALGSPKSIRTAVILNEILARPTDRW